MLKILRQVMLGALVCVLLASCTSTQFGYRFLDNLMRWRLNDYVSLQGQQSKDVDAALDVFHAWHQKNQLPLYSDFLSQQIKVLERPTINTAQLQQAYDKAMLFWGNSMRKLLPDIVTLMQMLDEQQIAQLQKNMDKKNEEYLKERVLPDQETRRKERTKRIVDSVKKWMGAPDKEQIKLIEQWASQLSYETAPRLEQRKLMRKRFDTALTVREQPQQVQQQLAQLIVSPQRQWTPAYRQYLQFNRQKTYQLLIDLHASLSDAQKKKLLGKLRDYREDFLKLSQK